MAIHFKKSVSILFKTTPFILLKFGVYFIIMLLSAGYFLLNFYISFKVISNFIVGLVLFIISILIYFALIKWVVRYITYMIKAAHIAVITELTNKGKLPEGQIKFGFKQAKSRFTSSTLLFVVDSVVNSILRRINRWVLTFVDKIPVKQIQQLLRFMLMIINIAVSYIDEAILSYLFSEPKKEGLKGAKEGLVLYFKSWKPILTTATVLVSISYGSALVLYYLLYYVFTPVFGALSYMFWIPLIFVAILIKLIFFDPFILVSMIVNYQEAIKGMTPDTNTENQLKKVVPDFDKIFEKARKKIS